MILHLAGQLGVPLRDRNQLLVAAGYAPSYAQRSLDDPDMAPVRAALKLVLAGYEPYPALVVDRHWHLLAANSRVPLLTGGVAAELVEPPVNVLRLSLHPDGLATRIVNLAEWRGHVLGRLAREAVLTGASDLTELHRELSAYPGGVLPAPPDGAVAVPLRLRLGDGELAFISTVTTFGTAVDVIAAELSVEAFLPADAATAQALRELSAGPAPS